MIRILICGTRKKGYRELVYKAKEGKCYYCDKNTNQYYTEDEHFICDECLIQLEESNEAEYGEYG